MKTKDKYIFLVFGVFIILLFFLFYYFQKPKVSKITPIPLISPAPVVFTYAKVIRVYDGDTIEIEGGQKIRYIGIDTAEVYPVRQCFSDEALNKNKKLVMGKIVKLEKDVSETDKYGRLLRYVYIDDQLVNDVLVKDGFAKIETVSPDVKYQTKFLESERYARGNNLGLWSDCVK